MELLDHYRLCVFAGGGWYFGWFVSVRFLFSRRDVSFWHTHLISLHQSVGRRTWAQLHNEQQWLSITDDVRDNQEGAAESRSVQSRSPVAYFHCCLETFVSLKPRSSELTTTFALGSVSRPWLWLPLRPTRSSSSHRKEKRPLEDEMRLFIPVD